MWMELQHFLQQNANRNPFIYCEVEQDLRCDESDEHPRHLDEEAAGDGVTFSGYAKVHSTPYAYDQGTEAKRDDPKGTPLLWFCHPLIWRVSRSGSISCRILHVFCGSVRQSIQQSEDRGVLHGDESEQPFIYEHIVCITFQYVKGM